MGDVDRGRRRVLQGGLAAGSLALVGPAGRAWAQTPLALLSLPKVALVMGNSRYKQAAPLKNPRNDARAMGALLGQLGFQVTTALDAGRAEMLAATQTYTQTLAAKKCVGLFYFAGHGVQLAWRNFLIPVDAEIEKVGDIEAAGVDLAGLQSGLAKAANPMNVIVLDACRDDPFGEGKRPEQKGLSQMDAPQTTLLAYATAPGNTAADGDGVNGLYTEHLLKELGVQGAKIEDVFKRVRLGVRRKSHGRQIPWESTSLEEDFYFVPPAELKKLSDEEKERRFKEELALWEKIQNSKESGPLEDYLRRYPSGNFSELAQLQLDRVLARQGEQRVQVGAAEGNPYTKGSAVSNATWKIGDSYTYRALDPESRKERGTSTSTVTRISDSEVTFSDGLVTDLLGNTRRDRDGRHFSANQHVPLEYAVGKQWVAMFTTSMPRRGSGTSEIRFRIVDRERITVPAGTFNAFRIEGHGFTWGIGPQMVEIRLTQWRDPDKVRRAVAHELFRKTTTRTITAERIELVSYTQS